MRYLSLFSGIEAATVAWKPLGWECVGVAEIEKFPSEVLKHHYPNIPNLGDITKITIPMIHALGRIDLIVGGFPCQDLSVAGKRAGFHDGEGNRTRSGLFYDAMRIVRWARVFNGCRFILIENVPGLFSSNNGRDFAEVVRETSGAEFAIPDGGWATSGIAFGEEGLVEWVTLDAQFFGVPQRRRRVFALGDFGAWASRPPILLESYSLSGNPPPRREKGETAPIIPSRSSAGGGLGTDFDCDGGLRIVGPLSANGGTENKHGFGMGQQDWENGYAIPVQEIGKRTGISTNDPRAGIGIGENGDPMYTLQAGAQHGVFCMAHGQANAEIVRDGSPSLSCNHEAPIVFDTTQITSAANYSNPKPGDPCHPLAAGAHPPAIAIQDGRGMDKAQNGKTLDGVSQQAVAFKPSHYTRGKDGAPQEVFPPLSADADKGDQEAVVAFMADDYKNMTFKECTVSGPLTNSPDRSRAAPITRTGMAVRRITPVEAERLQGFPDGYTNIPWRGKPESPDGPRYKALGNSFAVPVVQWIGERIQVVCRVDGV